MNCASRVAVLVQRILTGYWLTLRWNGPELRLATCHDRARATIVARIVTIAND